MFLITLLDSLGLGGTPHLSESLWYDDLIDLPGSPGNHGTLHSFESLWYDDLIDLFGSPGNHGTLHSFESLLVRVTNRARWLSLSTWFSLHTWIARRLGFSPPVKTLSDSLVHSAIVDRSEFVVFLGRHGSLVSFGTLKCHGLLLLPLITG